ncbi:MAG TPA: ribonuclease HI family protein [bacterium]|nr:ribonuclease HI family protein [bacterium]
MIEVWVDGACEPVNPGGTAGWGAHIRRGKEVLWEGSGMIAASPNTSNNVAEYMAFLEALKWLASMGLQEEDTLFRSDSRLVICQMFGDANGRKWRMKEGRYIKTAREAQALLRNFPRCHGVWIPREENGVADELSKREILKAGIKFQIQKEA